MLPEMPSSRMYSALYAVTDASGNALSGQKYLMTLPNGQVHIGETDHQGQSRLVYSTSEAPIDFTLLTQDRWMLEDVNSIHHEMDKHWFSGEQQD